MFIFAPAVQEVFPEENAPDLQKDVIYQVPAVRKNVKQIYQV